MILYSTRDMSRYMPLLAKSNPLTLVLNNIVDPKLKLDGQYEVTLSARFYVPTTNFPAVAQLAEISTVGHDEGYRIEKQLNFPKVINHPTLLISVVHLVITRPNSYSGTEHRYRFRRNLRQWE